MAKAERLVNLEKVTMDDLQVHAVDGLDLDFVIRFAGRSQNNFFNLLVTIKLTNRLK